jgi:hypothetical protein
MVAHDRRKFASVLLGNEHNDQAVLLASIVEALGGIEPVPPDIAAAISSPESSIENIVLPRLYRAMAELEVPLMLALDDLEQTESPQSLAAVAMIGTRPWPRAPSSPWQPKPSRRKTARPCPPETLLARVSSGKAHAPIRSCYLHGSLGLDRPCPGPPKRIDLPHAGRSALDRLPGPGRAR